MHLANYIVRISIPSKLNTSDHLNPLTVSAFADNFQL